MIIRQAGGGASPDLLIGGIRRGPSLSCGGVRNVFKRRELLVKFGERLLEHLAMFGGGRLLDLMGEILAGEQEALSLSIAFLLNRGEGPPSRLVPLDGILLLLFDLLTFPAARHLSEHSVLSINLPNKRLD